VSDTVESGGPVLGGLGTGGDSGYGPRNETGSLFTRGVGVFGRQREATVLVVAVALLLYFWLSHASSFASEDNAVDLLSEIMAPIAIIAIGEVMLLICGEIDISVGFIYTFTPFVMFYAITDYHVPVVLAVILALLAGVVIGWVNGFITVTLGVPSFITTIGTGFVLQGLALVVSHAEPQPVPLAWNGVGKWFGIPAATWQWAPLIWTVVLVLIFHVVLVRTRWGLYTIAAGGNLLGAREAGINVARIKYGNFMIMGFLGALVGVQAAFYTSDVDPSGGGYPPMFYAIIAAVIGGTAMLGGSGTILGAFLGAIVLATLEDGFTIAGINANNLPIIFGAAILIAMIANVQLARLRGRGRAI
jgi:simple sugar transport system permease protein